MDSRPAEFHCWYSANESELLEKGRGILDRYGRYLRDGPIVDLGCGEGALLLALKRSGRTGILGVDSSEDLLRIARSCGVPLVESDLWEYIRTARFEPALYFYLDVIEHVPLELNMDLLRAIPSGSRLIIQTPYTESLMGHRYYMNVPSHLAPYSPWVIKKMLARFGYRVVSEGSMEGDHPPTWKNKLRAFVLRKIMAVDPELILGGGNYFVVADRIDNSTT